MLNHISIMGRLVADPELRYTPKGTPVCSFRIACDRDVKNPDGEYDTDFIDIVAWRGLAENIARRFTKGRMVIIDGRLQLRPWVDRDGNRHYATEIVANRAYFGDRPKGEAEQPADDEGYGIRVDTEDHAYYMRLNPHKGEYNLYCYCYKSSLLAAYIRDRRETHE